MWSFTTLAMQSSMQDQPLLLRMSENMNGKTLLWRIFKTPLA